MANDICNTDDCPDEAYEIGVRDGYEKAVQDIDVMLGGDGVYFASTCGDDCRDPSAMKERILDRWNTRARVAPKVKPIAWGKTSYGTPEAKTVFGFYRVNRAANGGHSVCIGRRVLSREDGLTNFPTEQEAKDAAQSDFDGLALSALEI